MANTLSASLKRIKRTLFGQESGHWVSPHIFKISRAIILEGLGRYDWKWNLPVILFSYIIKRIGWNLFKQEVWILLIDHMKG